MFRINESLDIFPIRQQINKHDCSVCVLWCILNYFGYEVSYRELYRYIQPPTTPGMGVSGEEIIDLLKKFRIKTISEKSNITRLRNYTKNDCPVIVSIQHKRDRTKPWKHTVDYGHYVVVLKVDESRVKFMDPDYGLVKSLSIKDFKDRWHDGDESFIYRNPAIICLF